MPLFQGHLRCIVYAYNTFPPAYNPVLLVLRIINLREGKKGRREVLDVSRGMLYADAVLRNLVQYGNI